MPIVVLHIIKRPLKAKRAVAKAVSDAIVTALKVPHEKVHIVINEMTKEQYATSGVLYCDGGKKKAKKRK